MKTKILKNREKKEIWIAKKRLDEKINYLIDNMDLNMKQVQLELDENTQRVSARIEDMIASYERNLRATGSCYNWLTHELEELPKKIKMETNCDLSNEKIERELIKGAIRSKWAILDRWSMEVDEERIAVCPICGEKLKFEQQDYLISECIFGGGKLERLQCPSCGVIWGPKKMFRLTQGELAEDYYYHYLAYDEGDSTKVEIEVFRRLHPEKEKKYLNYGAGVWSKTIQLLREEGYDVWGYDPFAPESSEYIIREWEKVERMQFDGIFSHDLLEHLRYPEEELRKMTSVLKPDGIMIHSTACFHYVYEYTRFHLYFYTGNSINVLCDRLGLEIINIWDDAENLTTEYSFRKNRTVENEI